MAGSGNHLASLDLVGMDASQRYKNCILASTYYG
jgi:hypothetical protein